MALALVIRFIQGLGDSFVSTAGENKFLFLIFLILITFLAYSLVTIEFPTKREEYMGYCESAVGVGLMIGPVLGSLVYGFAGYEKTFYVFGSVIGLGLIAVFILLPKRLNHVNTEPKAAEEAAVHEQAEEGAQDHRHVSFKMILTNRRAMIAAVASMFSMIFMLFFDSILSVRL